VVDHPTSVPRSFAEKARALRGSGLRWSEIAARLGADSAESARMIARRSGYTSQQGVGRCRVCGAEIPRVGLGRLRELCDKHRAARHRARSRKQPAVLTCIVCHTNFVRRGRQVRCSACAERRRRERERSRDERRKTTKMRVARRKGYTTANWKRVSAAAKARAGECADCGSVVDLTAHLANDALKGDHSRATIEDVDVLCRRCHGRLRPRRSDRRSSERSQDARAAGS
jgi:5-methylcytosine-specific restriction endonuclease McrA